MKKLTINDATKDELLQYFFVSDGFGGGFRIPCAKDCFLVWLQKKRSGELLTAYEQSSDYMTKCLHEYIELVKKANEEPDLDKKLQIFEDANRAWEAYEKANKHREKAGDKMMEGYDE